jgi:hypothetical protein
MLNPYNDLTCMVMLRYVPSSGMLYMTITRTLPGNLRHTQITLKGTLNVCAQQRSLDLLCCA